MTVALLINDRRHVGWTEATVTRSIETISGAFTVTLSEREPGETTPRVIRPGNACRVQLEDETVLQGWVDAVTVDYDGGSHTIAVRGRDATGDLVDCSAASKPGEWTNERLENIAAALCEPFNIGVTREVDTGAPFARFRIEEGESVFEAIERACRFRAVLPLSDGRGGLILGGPSRSRTSVRLQRGENILSASGTASWLARFSDYTLLGQQAGGSSGGLFGGETGVTAEQVAHVSATAQDGGVDRYRPLTIIGEQSLNDDEALARIQWEANVRSARARSARVTVQGWQEVPDGPLWEPGRLVFVADEWLGIAQELLVSSTSQSLSAAGTLTTLDLVPQDAFVQRAEPAPSSGPAGLGANWWT